MDHQASDTLVRAARELLRWDQKLLAEKAGVGVATVRRFELGANVRAAKIEAIAAALQKAGVAFLGPRSNDVNIREGVALIDSRKARKKPPTDDGSLGAPPSATKAAPRATKTSKPGKPRQRRRT